MKKKSVLAISAGIALVFTLAGCRAPAFLESSGCEDGSGRKDCGRYYDIDNHCHKRVDDNNCAPPAPRPAPCGNPKSNCSDRLW